MFRNNNGAVAKRLAQRSLSADKRRNIIAVMAIALTALLFTSVFTMGFGLVESIQRATMVMSGGDGHAAIKYVTDKEYETISRNPLIKEMAYCRMLSDSVDNESLSKRHTEFWYYDDVGLKFGFAEPTGGHKPAAENEIISDTKTLELMGVPLEVGAPVTLDLTVHGRQVQRDFILAGWWESDPGFNVGQIFSSRPYVDAHLDELKNTYAQDFSLTGAITGYIKFKNSLNIENNLATVLRESGYSMDESAPDYMATGVNWAYMSAGTKLDAGTAGGLLGAMALFVLAGYLIIYNIFQISVLKDIRFYGLLKTIGTTNRQLRGIIRHQAMPLSLTGIPLGLMAGFFAGKAFVPALMARSSYAGSAVSVSPHPLIFVGAAAFALITVFISTNKPGKIAARVSPLEAMGYNDVFQGQHKKYKKSTKGARWQRMALANLGRSKKRTLLVVLSLSLSIILANTVFTLSQSVDVNKALKKFNASDFLIGHADLFNHKYNGADSSLKESFIEAVKKQTGFEDGGRLYGTWGSYTSEASRQTMNKRPDGSYSTAIYGLDPFPFSRLELVDGELNGAKLSSGNYLLEGVTADDRGNVETGSFNHQVGDIIDLNCGDSVRKMTVLGHVIVNQNTNADGTWMGSAFYLPGDVFKELTGVNYTMSFAFDVSGDEETDMETFLQQYTGSVEPEMSYMSKFTALSGLEGIQSTAVLVGGALSLIIGLIGILNFINGIMTSILARRREFAILLSIGMTRKQLKAVLRWEGGCYAILTAVVSAVLSIGCSLLIVRPFSANLWFMSFRFILWPLMFILPVLFILAVFIPVIAYHSTDRQSLVKMLRDAA